MNKFKNIHQVFAALFIGLLCLAPFAGSAQNVNGVTDQGESTTKVGGSYVNENGKLVCWPRVTSYGQLLTYGPIVTTDSVNSITSTTAVLYGNVVHDGWCGVTEQGFEVSTDANFTTIVATVTINPQPTYTPCTYPACSCAYNEYHKEVTGLTAGTHYYYRAYAENPCDPDPSYGDTLEFDTPGAGYVAEVTGPSPVQFCPGGSQSATYTASVSPAMTSPTYQWFLDGTAVTGETSSTYTTTFSVTGTHAVKCEITEGGSTVDGTKSVTVSNYTVPALAIDAPNDPICAGTTGNLSATGFSSYTWSSNVASSSSNTATYTAAGTYSVTATTTEGCTATASKAVTVTDPQVASATGITGNTIICSGSTTTLTANATASTGASLQYQWKKNGTAISGATSASYTTEALTANTSYSCDVAAVQDGCTSAPTTLSAAVTIEESTLASVSIAPASQTICAGETASMTANASGYNGTLSYQWKQGSTNVGTSASYTTPALSATTTYTCVVTNTTTHGCATSMNANTTVTVTTPAVAINSITASPSTVCVGSTATLTPTMGSYTGTLSYHWSTGETTSSITTAALTSATTYTLTVTATSGGCTATATKSITVTPTNTSATTGNVASITCVSATLVGSNTACSDARGFVYSATNSTPTVGGTGCTDLSVPNGTGSFTYGLTGRTPNTTYYVQAYSHSANGYVYGGVKSFKTSEITVNVVADNGSINLCVVPNQTTVDFVATPSCDAFNTGNTYTWSLDPVYPYTASADGKTITVTVTSSTAVNVTATCTLHHSTGYTNSGSDYSIITVTGNPPEICICEDAFAGSTTITSIDNISTIDWYQGANADTDHDSPISAMHNTGTISTSSYTEGYYTILATSPLGCKNTRTVALGFPYERCASLGTTGNTSETISGGGVKQITDSRQSPTPYRVVKIGSQCWMAENLRYVQSEDGRSSAYSKNDLVNNSIYTYRMYFTWPSSKTLSNGTTVSDAWLTQRYGYLYTWIGVMDAPATLATRSTMYPYEQIDFRVQGICPDGWHLPTDGEWFQLEKEMGVTAADSAVVITSMRPSNDIEGTVHDILHSGASRGYNVNAGTQAASGCEWYQNGSDDCPEDYCNLQRNTTGFSGMPAGVFVPQYADRDACFQILGEFGTYWSASQALSAHAGHDDFSDAAYVHQLKASQGGWGRYRADKHNGLSVRCVRNMVTTAAPTNATTSSVTVGGNVLEDGGFAITERGICWSQGRTPTIADSRKAVAGTTGAFTTTLTSSDIPDGEYNYCAYAINSKGVYYGFIQTVEILSTPSVVTGSTSGIATSPSNSITLHGEVTATGGDPLTTRGICWSTSANPTISDSYQDDSGTGAGAYSVTIAPASATTTYHYRAYATNSMGTTYGADHTFILSPCAGQNSIVIDGDSYTLIEVGSQCWTTNLRATHYADGVAIQRGSPEHGQAGSNVYANPNSPDSDIEAYYYEPYNVTPGNIPTDWSTRVTTWGRLYNWAAATRRESGSQVQGICPNGWHVPTISDWNTLMAGRTACDVCKPERWPVNTTIGSPGWGVWAYTGTPAPAPVYTPNSTHFSVDAAGYMIPGSNDLSAVNTAVNYWCGDRGTYPIDMWFTATSPNIGAQHEGNFKDFGFYVRCVKN